jgi:hypothetical protein
MGMVFESVTSGKAGGLGLRTAQSDYFVVGAICVAIGYEALHF